MFVCSLHLLLTSFIIRGTFVSGDNKPIWMQAEEREENKVCGHCKCNHNARGEALFVFFHGARVLGDQFFICNQLYNPGFFLFLLGKGRILGKVAS